MERERFGGTAMIVGATMGVVTMAFHPTARGMAANPSWNIALDAAVHALAIASLPFAFVGGLALTRRLASRSPLAEVALGFYMVSLVAALMAGTQDGFLTPGLFLRMNALTGEARAGAEAVLRFGVDINQTFAKILVAAGAVAIGMWSAAALRSASMRRGTATYGCLLATAALAITLSGHLPLGPHGFGLIVLAEAVWLVLTGIELRRGAP